MEGQRFVVVSLNRDRCVECGFCRSVLYCHDRQACNLRCPQCLNYTTTYYGVGEAVDPQLQLCVLDYFPSLRRHDLHRPHPSEMLEVKRILEGAGLRTVTVQTDIGHLGPR
jgi:pyruvate-formate lyase-activating enzyme